MKIILLFIALYLTGCTGKREQGSLSGNVFWKYNNFVGNKPDAGSKIKLYSMDDAKITFSATADVAGNYKIENIPTGRYVIIVSSSNTRNDPYSHVRVLSAYAPHIEKISGEVYPEVFTRLTQQAQAFDSLASKSLTMERSSIDTHYRYGDSAKKYASLAIDTLPLSIKIVTGVYTSMANKVDIGSVSIEKDKTATEVTDFGITYF